MAKALDGIRQKLSRAAEKAKGVQRLHASGIVDLGNLGVTLQTVKNSRVYGPQATMAIQGDVEEIKLHVKNNLARYKVPRDVVLSTAPNATGKLSRRA